MKNTGFLCFILLLFGGCHNSEEDVFIEKSDYTGTFLRIIPDADAVESPVTLQLSNGFFTGQADSLHYPAICEGTYTVEGSQITFSNGCLWTADFDWSFILSGTFTVEENPNETLLIQELSNGEYNIYRLD